MRKTIAVLLATLLLIPFVGLRSIPNKMQSSTVLLRMKIHAIQVNEETGEKKEKSGWGSCSGVYIKPNVILTAAHCIDFKENEELTLKEIWIKSGDVSERAVVIKDDPTVDLALLYTPLSGVPVKFSFRAIRGEDCWVIGNPLGLRDIITRGIVSQINVTSEDEKASFLVVDATALPGNSGGAVVDSDGHLIGILTRSTSLFGSFGAAGLGIAVDLKTIRTFLRTVYSK